VGKNEKLGIKKKKDHTSGANNFSWGKIDKQDKNTGALKKKSTAWNSTREKKRTKLQNIVGKQLT